MTNLYFAALENHGDDLAREGVEYGLASYYNISDPDTLKLTPNVMLDSGAHSIHEGERVDIIEFCKEYIQFVKDNWEEIDHYVELDVEVEYGMEKTLECRRMMEEELPEPPLVVWHRERGVEGWKKMCKNYDYVGFSGFVTKGGDKEVPDRLIPWFLEYAREHDTKVHGFGLTQIDKLKRYDFYSADSTTYLNAMKFGEYHEFKRGNFRKITADDFPERFGKDFSSVDNYEKLRWNIRQWKKFHKHLKQKREM